MTAKSEPRHAALVAQTVHAALQSGARLAVAIRDGAPPAKVGRLRTESATARIARFAAKVACSSPPLSSDQIARVTAVLQAAARPEQSGTVRRDADMVAADVERRESLS